MFNKLKDEVNASERKIWEETGRVPEFEEIAGNKWETHGWEVQHLKDILSKYEPGWDQYGTVR